MFHVWKWFLLYFALCVKCVCVCVLRMYVCAHSFSCRQISASLHFLRFTTLFLLLIIISVNSFINTIIIIIIIIIITYVRVCVCACVFDMLSSGKWIDLHLQRLCVCVCLSLSLHEISLLFLIEIPRSKNQLYLLRLRYS